MTHLFKLDNVIQDYIWGSKTSIASLFEIENPNNAHQAEIWMGAHPNGCSKRDNDKALLSELIKAQPEAFLGQRTTEQYGELPYLLKVLAAAKPLSIQVHPEKSRAAAGFEKENQAGIPVTAGNRNYKDPNHKPELVYALTPYLAMNGFRVFEEIISLFEQASVPSLEAELAALKSNPESSQLKAFFAAVMSLEGEARDTALSELLENIESKGQTEPAKQAFAMVVEFHAEYPTDIGLFAPLMLNLIELQPGEAMFLFAETPHAYLRGTGMEIMANSDNVLRAGLTPKFIDVPELIDNTKFEPIPFDTLKTAPVVEGNRTCFPVPVEDFKIDILTSTDQAASLNTESGEILFCLTGNVTVKTGQESVALKSGESVFISFAASEYQFEGEGQLVRAYN